MAVQLLFRGMLPPGSVQHSSYHSCAVPVSFFSIRFVSVYVVHPYSSIDKTAAWKKFRFNLSDRSDLHIIDSLSIAVHTFARRILTSLSVDETLLPRNGNLSTNFRWRPFRMEISPRLKHVETSASCYLLQIMQKDSTGIGVYFCKKCLKMG